MDPILNTTFLLTYHIRMSFIIGSSAKKIDEPCTSIVTIVKLIERFFRKVGSIGLNFLSLNLCCWPYHVPGSVSSLMQQPVPKFRTLRTLLEARQLQLQLLRW
jgi:hypothetical protein